MVDVIRHTRSAPFPENTARFMRLLVELEYFTGIERPLDCTLRSTRNYFSHMKPERMAEIIADGNKDDLRQVLREYGEALIELSRDPTQPSSTGAAAYDGLLSP